METISRPVADALARAFDFLDERLRQIDERQGRVQNLLASIHAAVVERRANPEKISNQKWFTPTEAAELLSKRPYTVREWCRLRRINARKRPTGRGEAEEWEISVEEIERYKNHELLPRDH